jgi:hypothetical protein
VGFRDDDDAQRGRAEQLEAELREREAQLRAREAELSQREAELREKDLALARAAARGPEARPAVPNAGPRADDTSWAYFFRHADAGTKIAVVGGIVLVVAMSVAICVAAAVITLG